MLTASEWSRILMPRSEGLASWRQKTVRSSRKTRCRSKAKGRCLRDERAQVRPEAILPTHHVRIVPGVPPNRRGVPMRGLPIRMSQEMLSQGGHQVYLQIQRRWRKSSSIGTPFMLMTSGRRRGEDQSPDPASLLAVHQYVGELVLSLWIHDAFWSEELGQMFRWVDRLGFESS